MRSCGPIIWGSRKNCLLASLYDSISSHAANFPGFSYFELKVTHMDSKPEECVSCIGSIVGSDFQYIRKNAGHFYVDVRSSTSHELQKCVRVGVCENVEKKSEAVPGDMSKFKFLSSHASKSKASITDSRKKIRTATYHCMHQSSHPCSEEQGSPSTSQSRKAMSSLNRHVLHTKTSCE